MPNESRATAGHIPGASCLLILILFAIAGSARLAAQSQAADEQPAKAAQEKDAGSRWEVEVHGAFAFNSSQTAGTGALPITGDTLSGQLSLISFYFGSGAQQFNQAIAALPGGATAPKIVPLDAGLQSAGIERQAQTPALGVRVARSINARFGWEVTVDASRPDLTLTGATLSRIEATRASFVPTIQGVLGSSSSPAVTSTVTTTSPAKSSLAFATGALTVNLRESGRAMPYVVGGGGMAVIGGDAPGATLVGTYRFGATTAVLGSDSVALRYSLHSPAATGVAGGGVKYAVSPRWGLRVDGRVYIYENTLTGLVDATPGTGISTTGDPLPIVRAGTLQFSATAPLTGGHITGATVFKGAGLQTQINVSAGIFWRF